MASKSGVSLGEGVEESIIKFRTRKAAFDTARASDPQPKGLAELVGGNPADDTETHCVTTPQSS